MISHHSKIYIAVTVIIVAVILLGIGIFNLVSSGKKSPVSEPEEKVEQGVNYRHPLSGQPVEAPVENFFAVAIMFDNAYDSRPQYGLDQADIVYEALAEGNITRIMGIFDSQKNIEKIGPVRSARLYFMDMAGEYGGVYMHVGGAPNALAKRGAYSFSDVDQIGAGEIYFWRDNDLSAPHNVFTSSANWLRAGDIKEVPKFSINRNWNFTVGENATITDLTIDYNGPYKVDCAGRGMINLFIILVSRYGQKMSLFRCSVLKLLIIKIEEKWTPKVVGRFLFLINLASKMVVGRLWMVGLCFLMKIKTSLSSLLVVAGCRLYQQLII